VVERGAVELGINETRKLLEQSWIDRVKCQRGLEALQAYRREWDERLRMFREKPLHDWSEHGSSALRTFAMGFRDHGEARDIRPEDRHAQCRYDVLKPFSQQQRDSSMRDRYSKLERF
jgi:hypothetical protein